MQMIRISAARLLGFIALLFMAACASSTGTKITAADASAFAENTATQAQVRDKFGKPSSTTTVGTRVCDQYTYGTMSAMTGAFESTSASFCYDDHLILVRKTFMGQVQ